MRAAVFSVTRRGAELSKRIAKVSGWLGCHAVLL